MAINCASGRAVVFAAALHAWIPSIAFSTGVQPETTILLISEQDRQAEMVVTNTEDNPTLLQVEVIDLPEDQNLSVFALPAISRIEARSSQMVRFYLQKPDQPLKVQSLKRVSFEGIPGQKKPDRGEPGGRPASVRLTVRHTIPMVISPAGLEQDNEPWKFLEARLQDAENIELHNPSPFVIRLSTDVTIAPATHTSPILQRNYILPGERFSVSYAGIAAGQALTVMRIYPASPWGLAAPPYDIRIVH